MKQVRLKILSLSAAFGLLVSFSNAATVNLSLTVAPEDGFTLRDSIGNFLPETGIVKIGYFYDAATGNGLNDLAISALYSNAASFSANNSALLGKFLEIGSAQIGVNSFNGLGEGYFADTDGVDRLYGAPSFNSPRLDDFDNLRQGSFFRGWMDGTLAIQTLGTAPFNSIGTVKLTGAYLSVIAYNNESLSRATELLVARSLSALPTSDEATSFALGATTSELLIGTAVSGGYQWLQSVWMRPQNRHNSQTTYAQTWFRTGCLKRQTP
jgi:hypothetical protein